MRDLGALVQRQLPKSLIVRKVLRRIAVVSIDATAVFLTLTLLLSIADLQFFPDLTRNFLFLLSFTAIVTSCLALSGLYRLSWRYLSFADCVHLAFSVSIGSFVAWLAAMGVPSIRGQGLGILPVAINHWALLIASLGAARMARRGLREWSWRNRTARTAAAGSGELRRVLLVGPPQWARSVLELSKSDNPSILEVVGVLVPQGEDTIERLGHVPVLGGPDRLDEALSKLQSHGKSPDSIIACDDGLHFSHRDMCKVARRAREIGLEIFQVKDHWRLLLDRSPGIHAKQLSVEELLGRDEFNLSRSDITKQIERQSVLVTGAGGTIGSELCRQIASFKPSRLVLLDHSEFNLYTIEIQLREQFPDLDIRVEICSVCQKELVRNVFRTHKPVIIYHAAALKHVPIVEQNPCAGVETNIVGTRVLADAVCEFSSRAMIQISTDKAVNPVGMMGATKRVGELYNQALDLCGVDDSNAPRFMTVRFGNVLGSSGSIVPLFERQLRDGKPLTVTHPDIERYFMTVREAVQLTLQSSSSAIEQGTPRGRIFVLDMGAPIRIVDLARRMIRLYGLEPEVDVPIEFIGLRPGEKLYEELFDVCEAQTESRIEGIFEARSSPIPLPLITQAIDLLERAALNGDVEEVHRLTHHIVKLPAHIAQGDVILAVKGGFHQILDSRMSN